MSKEPIYTLIIDEDDDFVSPEEYEEAISDEVKMLMESGYNTGSTMDDFLCKNPNFTLYALLFGETEERVTIRKAVVEAFREVAKDNLLSDGLTEVPLTFHNFVEIFRELGADTVKALTVAAFD